MQHQLSSSYEPRTKMVAVAGNVGAGKAILSQALASELGCGFREDFSEKNPYLPDFYGDRYTWAFHSQLYFLAYRSRIHRELMYSDKDWVVVNRCIYEDAEVFARNLYQMGCISERDYQTYQAIYCELYDSLPSPDLVVYLRASVTTLIERIARRGRVREQALSEDYLARLNGLYEAWISSFRLSPIVCVDTDHLDHEHSELDRKLIVHYVRSAVDKVERDHEKCWTDLIVLNR